MEKISHVRAFSSPELAASSPMKALRPEDYSLEGIATNVKLLLKLIQEHNGASTNDDRKMQRIAGMITILDDVKSRIEKSQSARKRLAELRRCNTELRPSRSPRDKKPQEAVTSTDDNERLRKQLSTSLAARKSLEIMCSSLGKEKEIMACELARKVSELNEMEELVSDLKAQNDTLLTKLQSHAAEHKEKKTIAGDAQGNAALQDRNKVLSEQLLNSLDSYRSLKRKYKDAKKENSEIRKTMEEIGVEVIAGIERIRSFRQRMASSKDQPADIEEEISALEQMFQRFNMKISKHEEQNSERAKPKAEISASSKPPVLA
ncbi:hypothetical protein P3X46_032945 [Hevea brasiliensis]|uniref:Uncharacterized protein n=1 Tax=Hevea brasiliensis TaxID=3981 RepID=A0ABQ9KEW2_HEVBR|nr:uncharacterized protein LOC110651159 [Hevea brasiliensis]KAJ9135810.1 hypothetical protein P3X46_032945 [Hevea brasiliensis]